MRRDIALQTRQIVQHLNYETIRGNANLEEFPLFSPTELENTGVLTSGSDEKVHVFMMSQNLMVTNQSTVAAHVKVIKVRCLRTYDSSTSSGAYQLMGINAFNISAYPFCDPTTSTTFRRYYHIQSVKTKVIMPGRFCNIKQKVYNTRGRIMRGDVEGLNNNIWYKGEYGVLLFFSSMPYIETASELDQGFTGTTDACTLVVTAHKKITYRLIEDNDPSSAVPISNTASVSRAVQYNQGVIYPGAQASDASNTLPPVYTTT